MENIELYPIAVLLLPVEFEFKDWYPKAELLSPVVRLIREENPTPVLNSEVVIVKFPELVPKKVFLFPKLCKNRFDPLYITPMVGLTVFSSRSEFSMFTSPVDWLSVKKFDEASLILNTPPVPSVLLIL